VDGEPVETRRLTKVVLPGTRRESAARPQMKMFSFGKITGPLKSLLLPRGIRASIFTWGSNETSLARTKLILDVAGDGIYGLDVGGKITFANHAAARMLGAKRRDIVGRPMREIVEHLKADGSPFPGGTSPIVGAASEGTSCVSSDEIFRRNDGASLVVDYVSNPIFERGRLTGAVVAFTDVTHRKRSEEELQARYRELAILHEVGQMIFASMDLNVVLGNIVERALALVSLDVGNVRLVEPDGGLQIVAHRGYRVPEQVGKQSNAATGRGFVHGVIASRKSLVVEDLSTTEGLRTFKKEEMRSAIIVPITTADETLGVIEFGSRVPRKFRPDELRLLEAIGNQIGIAVQKARLFEETERRNREIKLAKEKLEKVNSALTVQAAELARSNTELQHFAYIASHDLQEPLRMVASYMQLLARRYKGKLDQDADEFIGFAVDGATRMQALINALLTYSRVGTKAKKFEPTDCEEVLDGVLAGLRAAVEDSGAVITRDPLPTVTADVTQLGQLFQNLIGNGIKFHGAEPPRIHIACRKNGQGWVFSIRDHGIGFDAKYAERIFVMFQRLHAKGEYPGTGIGLAVCKKIVERHGGEIWVESQPGQGATFYFTIPTNGHEKENDEHAFSEHERIG
jgi:PAS domain S-box-containing protein